MQTFNKFFLALAFLGGSAAAQAADGSDELARVPMSKGGERFDRFGEHGGQHNSNVWSQGLSEQGDGDPRADRLYSSAAYDSLSGRYNGVPVAQKTLSGHFDLHQTMPVALSAESASQQDWKPVQRVL
jgi:hypothetical protein